MAVEFGFGFELKCPKPSQWAFRKHMCGTPEKYSCLYDIKRNIYVESCVENIDFVKAGKHQSFKNYIRNKQLTYNVYSYTLKLR